MLGFFFEGETSFEGLVIDGGVIGRETGGALRGERSLIGVGELQLVSRGLLWEMQSAD